MDYRRQSGGGRRSEAEGGVSRAMDGGDPRTPMAWQHRDTISNYQENYRENTRTPGSSRYRYPGTGPTTPSTSGRKERAQSSDRYSNRSRGSKGRQDRRQHYGPSGGHGGHYGRGGQHSPSSTDNTTEETTETDSQPPEQDRSDYNGPVIPGYPVMVGYPMFSPSLPMMVPGTGSIRSVQSVPMLSPPAHTWDGEPCPVHHQHQQMVPLAALYGMGGPGMGYPHTMSYGHSSVPPSIISGATTVRRARSVAEMSLGTGRPYSQPPTPGHDIDDRKSFHASMASLGPSLIMPPHMRHGGGGRVVVGENGAPSQLPTREVAKKISPLPGKELGKDEGFGCCSGHFVVLWIILGIITFGVLLGIVLKFTIS